MIQDYCVSNFPCLCCQYHWTTSCLRSWRMLCEPPLKAIQNLKWCVCHQSTSPLPPMKLTSLSGVLITFYLYTTTRHHHTAPHKWQHHYWFLYVLDDVPLASGCHTIMKFWQHSLIFVFRALYCSFVFNFWLLNFRISDRGGGIPHHLMERVLEYNFTTANEENSDSSQEGHVFSDMMEAVNPNPAGGPMHGSVDCFCCLRLRWLKDKLAKVWRQKS